MTKKTGLTLDQHRSIGLELARMRDRLIILTTMISNSYPKITARRTERAADQLDQLRAELDGRLATEHPNDFNTHIYYPSQDQRNERTNTQ